MAESEKTGDSDAARAWYLAALVTSIVAGVLSVIVCLFLVIGYFGLHAADVLESEELAELKEAVAKRPADEALRKRVRELDLELRKEYFRLLDLSAYGAPLLAGCIICFLASVKLVFALKKRLPMPQGSAEDAEAHSRASARARWSVASVGVLLGLAAIVLIVKMGVGLPQPVRRAQMADAGYPSAEEVAKNWPRFRGPGGLGISAYTNVPSTWDGKTGRGILWKTAVPLPGMNSPVLWGKRVFLTGADKHARQVYCFDIDTGELLWQREVRGVGRASTDLEVGSETGYAAPTCATDGRRVFAIFANGDLACFDFEGKRLWARSFGIPDNTYGHASSLTTYRGMLFVLYDQGMAEDGKSALYALDTVTGKTIWRAQRNVESSWISPIVIEAAGRAQIITCATPWVIAYDPANGSVLWGVECLVGEVAPSPIFAGGLVFATNDSAALVAIRPESKGVLTDTGIVWKAYDGLPNTVSPVSDGKLVFLVAAGGLLTCYDAKDGKKVWDKYVEGMGFTASPTLVGNRIYLLDTDGVMLIIESARKFKELGRAELGEQCYASPAFADGRIYIRGETHLYCITEE
ncbi:MAG: PQQ-binding-like beta-propeller repeat protein [Planctomycetia bacterium]|nr:PQQ-binding-like beta-propeller repeat protein [Planctomycetia bacterium]